jgi:two-component system chemotaxis response regulator CheY
MRFLIVDDTKSIHSFVRVLLAKVPGLELESVFNGEEALQRLAAGERYDLVLLDWEMPVLNGPGTLAKIAAMGYSVPVVMMTTKNAPDEIAQMLKLGATEYLMKPFTADILFEKLSLVTGRDFSYAA